MDDHCPRCHGDGIDPDCDGRDEFDQFACTACEGAGRPRPADPIRPERLAEIREALAAITTHRPTAYADRDRARDRWTLNSSDYAAGLLDQVDRLTAELDDARSLARFLRLELIEEHGRDDIDRAIRETELDLPDDEPLPDWLTTPTGGPTRD